MLTIANLLDEPSLRFTLAAGEPGLGNRVLAAHTSELTDVSPWLQGGELLMTVGLFLPQDLPGCRGYVSNCQRGGIAGLVLGLGADLPFQDAPDPLVEAADEAGLPLLLLPDPIPFIAVTKWVFARLADAERREWQDAVSITRDLTAAAASLDPLTSVLETWETSLSASAAVTDLGGDAHATAGLGADVLLARVRHLLEATPAGRPVPSSIDADGVQVYALGASAPRGLLVLEKSDDPRTRHALAVLVSLLSLEMDHRYAYGNPERARRARVATQLLSSGVRAEAAQRLAAGVDLKPEPHRVVVVRALEHERTEELASQLTSTLHRAVARPRPGSVDLIVPDLDSLMTILERAAPGHPIGISALTGITELHVGAKQADSLADIAAHLGHAVQAEESGATQLLLQIAPPEVLTAYSRAVLAPLDALDERERNELLRTVEEWLHAGGAWEPAATSLSVHRNTVRNRIGRITELLGRDLGEADQRMELWLALQARVALSRARPDRDS